MYGYQFSSNASSLWRLHGNLPFRAAMGIQGTTRGASVSRPGCIDKRRVVYEPHSLYLSEERGSTVIYDTHVEYIADTCPPGRAASSRSYPRSRRRRRR